MYAMASCVDVPSKVGDLETLILITSCICHDLDHPGYNNIYQVSIFNSPGVSSLAYCPAYILALLCDVT